MNPFAFVKRRPVSALLLVVVVIGGGLFAMHRMRVNIPALHTSQLYVQLDNLGAKAGHAKEYLTEQYNARFHKEHKEESHHEGGHQILVTSPLAKDVTIAQEYVCQIHSQRHINIQALESGYLEAIPVKEGQSVKKGDLMFKVIPVLYQARMDAECAERDLAQLKYNNTKRLLDQKVVAPTELALLGAELARAQAKVKLAEAELNFASVRAPFDGIVDRLHEQQGSLVKEGDMLTTLSDNSTMWVYFNVTEKRYLEYKAEVGQSQESPDIELRLANHNRFPHIGKIGAIEAKFNNETGTIPFRADFPNPEGLLRHGQTGSVVISRKLKDAIVIPQRATFETLAKRYVYVVDKNEEVHQREIAIQYEQDDIYVIEKGVGVEDKIVLEGIRQVHEGEKIESVFRDPKLVLENMKVHAE